MKLTKNHVTTCLCALILGYLPLQVQAQDAPKPSAASTAGLPIAVPVDVRVNYVHLGSWIVPDASAPGHGFHDVYTQRKTVDAYRKTGKFADRTVLVKEIRKIANGALTTGAGSWATDPKVWFVMVKDAKGKHKSSPLWGDGWLWALYSASDPTHNIAVSYANDCKSCHIPAAKTDRVFIQGYPTLKKP
jgi:hypothetical protein